MAFKSRVVKAALLDQIIPHHFPPRVSTFSLLLLLVYLDI